MSDRSDSNAAPSWVVWPISAAAPLDESLHAQIRMHAARLAEELRLLLQLLLRQRGTPAYDAALNLANALVWQQREQIFSGRPAQRLQLLSYACELFPRAGMIRVLRRMAKDDSPTVRRAAAREIRARRIREVALPLAEQGVWDESGWGYGRQQQSLDRHGQGTAAQSAWGVAEIGDVRTLRELLEIRTEKQLGWMLTATDRDDGPYIRFTIAKRDGSDRPICAPKWQLRRAQRRILDEILARVAPHPAAHGFVKGRSIVSNAAAHVGAKVVLKFDLRSFFPTIHWCRVLGLFASLGYYAGNCRLSRSDDGKNVAMVLTRLCTYTPDPKQWSLCATPQGAPTSPAIANLVCRGLDARLAGLAQRCGGTYTRYADDLTLSFRDSAIDVARLRWWVDQICHQEGFFVNQSKFRIIRATRRQVVTGIVVNDTMRIRREERRKFRAILHNCQKHGIESQRRGRSDFKSYLLGFASYIHMVDPNEGRELLAQVAALIDD